MANGSRTTPRITCRTPGVIEGPRGSIRGEVRNLSIGGSFFTSSTLIPVGQSISMKITMPEGQPVEAVGEVRYHHRYPEGLGMGIRFLRLGAQDVARLTAFIGA